MKNLIISAYLVAYSLLSYAQNAAPKPYGAIPNPQQLNWQRSPLYGFIHFGINTFTDKEWGMGDESPELFNPSNFDAEQIVRTFKAGGFEGVILTAKHHDGFCLWPTKTTDHNITKSPFRNGKGDLVREVADACKKYGLKLGIYLSPWDRNSAKYGTPEYVEMYREQFKELLTQYGEVFEIWHDGANGGDGYYGGAKEKREIDRSTYYNWPSVWEMERKLQPNAVIFGDIGADVRWVGNESGFAGNPCWATYTPISLDSTKSPSNGTIKYWLSVNGTRNGKYWMPAETDFSIRPGWFWHEKENNKVKSAKVLWEHYIMSIGRGATMLLNIPPDQRGQIYREDSIQVQKFGNYIKNVFKENLMKNAQITSTNTRGNSANFAAKNLIDDNQDTYFATDDAITNPTIEIKLAKKQRFNLIQFKEFTALGQRIDSVTVEALIDGKYQFIGGANSIGINKIIALDKSISTQNLRIKIEKAAVCPAISEIGLYFAPPIEDETNSNKADFKAQNKSAWRIQNSKSRQAIDNNLKTIFTASNNSLVLNLAKISTIGQITYYPDPSTNGLITKYELYTSIDGKKWAQLKTGEFANIKANPIPQSIELAKKTKAQYIKLVATELAEGKQIRIAELGVE